jgi:hypothetical protein
MLKKNSSELTLVVPVYRGGLMFIEALRSAEQSQMEFKKIVVSFNEVNDKDFQTFHNACLIGVLNFPYTVFRTNKEMRAHEHGRFIVDKLKISTPMDAMILFLAHDDRIIVQPSTKAHKLFYSTLQSDAVYFPSYSCCRIEDIEKIIVVIEHEEVISPEVFFWRTQKQNLSTNMSGMIVPLGAWDEALKTLVLAGSGARFEHLLAIARPINHIRFHKFMKTLIVERPGSDAATLTLLDHRRASLYYLYAFARNLRVTGVLNRIRFMKELIKKSLALFLAKVL